MKSKETHRIHADYGQKLVERLVDDMMKAIIVTSFRNFVQFRNVLHFKLQIYIDNKCPRNGYEHSGWRFTV